jgi:hypothetical protein
MSRATLRVGDDPGKSVARQDRVYLLIVKNLRRFAVSNCHGDAGEDSSKD